MRLFAEVELPETCYFSEAALWVSLGRVPLADWELLKVGKDYKPVEHRKNPDLTWDGAISQPYDFISAAEFRALGISVDYPRYEEAAAGTDWKSGADLMREFEEREARFAVQHDARAETEELKALRLEMRREAEENAEKADWARAIEEPFEPLIDRGRVAIFEALSKGELRSHGWLYFSDKEMEENEGDGPLDGPPGRFVDIPPERWALRYIDWEQSALRRKEMNYFCVQVLTQDLLDRFPEPLIRSETVSGSVYGGTLVSLGDGLVSPPLQQRKGRRRKGDGLVEKAMVAEFKRRAEMRQLPSKKEAVLQEACQWAEAVLGEAVSRSAAQRYLRPVLDA